MPRIGRTEFLAGLLMVSIGLFLAVAAQEYRMGTFARMGPGYVPYWLGIISIVLGCMIVLAGIGRDSPLPTVSLRASAAVFGAVLLFALLLPRVGLVPTVFLCSALAMLGTAGVRPLSMVLVPLTIALGCWLVFIIGLGLRLSAWRVPF